MDFSDLMVALPGSDRYVMVILIALECQDGVPEAFRQTSCSFGHDAASFSLLIADLGMSISISAGEEEAKLIAFSELREGYHQWGVAKKEIPPGQILFRCPEGPKFEQSQALGERCLASPHVVPPP
jgi:hypothetical protein